MKIKANTDREAVLLTLDQLSQTMEVMHQVVSRLKRSVELAEAKPASSNESTDLRQSPSDKGARAEQPQVSPVISRKRTVTLH